MKRKIDIDKLKEVILYNLEVATRKTILYQRGFEMGYASALCAVGRLSYAEYLTLATFIHCEYNRIIKEM